tara:strand:+ start:292 stop:873 length:582 start_codon:yes stop_codon:yes gene_type:complete
MNIIKILDNNLENHIITFDKLKTNFHFKSQLVKALILLKNSIKKGGKIIFIGNGGSAADSQHLSAELVGKFLKKRKPLPAIALSTDTSILTSISNDTNFDHVFSRQIMSIGNKNDVLIAITTSGKSQNIINAIQVCRKRKIKTICLTKENYPKKLKKLCNVVLGVPAQRVDRIQEMHIFIGHTLCEILEKELT